MKYLTQFNSNNEYLNNLNTLDCPNVSLIENDNVLYKQKVTLTFLYQYNNETIYSESHAYFPNEQYNVVHSGTLMSEEFDTSANFAGILPNGGTYYTYSYSTSNLIGTAPSHDSTLIISCSREEHGGSVKPPSGGGGAA